MTFISGNLETACQTFCQRSQLRLKTSAKFSNFIYGPILEFKVLRTLQNRKGRFDKLSITLTSISLKSVIACLILVLFTLQTSATVSFLAIARKWNLYVYLLVFFCIGDRSFFTRQGGGGGLLGYGNHHLKIA